jgi:hypothetical protein
MTIANLTRFERAFDRSAAVFLLFLGLTSAGATALIGY